MKPRVTPARAGRFNCDRLDVRTARNNWTTCPLQWARILSATTVSRIYSWVCTQPMAPGLDGYVDWVVDDLKWGTLQDGLGTEEEARALSSRTGGGAIYRRSWKRVE